MLQEAITAIKNLFEDHAIRTSDLPGDSRTGRFLVNNGRHAKPEVLTIQKEIFERNHQFTDLDSFLDFLNRADVGRTDVDMMVTGHPGLVFVSSAAIEATLLYGHPLRHTATLPIEDSEGYVALRNLFAGLSQKALWRALITALDTRVDPLLLLQISSLGIRAKDDREFTIRQAGLTQGQTKNSLIVSTLNPATGEQVSEIRTDWVFRVRFWECFDREYDIPTVLEIEPTETGLVFIFHPRGLADIVRGARQDLVAQINTRLPTTFKAYCGDYGNPLFSDLAAEAKSKGKARV